MAGKVNLLVKLLKKKNLTIAFAESMTCGLAAHQLSTVKGTSAILIGGIVCYQELAKHQLLEIPYSLIEAHTAESKEVTDALVKHLSEKCTADIYAAVTGLSAPGGSENKAKPVGTVFFSVLFRRKIHRKRKYFTGTPLQIRKKSCESLYDFIVAIAKN